MDMLHIHNNIYCMKFWCGDEERGVSRCAVVGCLLMRTQSRRLFDTENISLVIATERVGQSLSREIFCNRVAGIAI